MISPKLRRLFLISIPLFIVHGIEEYLTGFTGVVGRVFEASPQGLFLLSQIMWWSLLVIFYLSLLGAKWQLRFMTFIGVILIFELWHIVEALRIMSYYPGVITAFLFPILGFFFWKELLHTKSGTS